MNLISWLLVGHLIGDWLLQNNWMASGKNKALVTKAGMVHYFIYTATITSMIIIFYEAHQISPGTLLWVIVVVFISHWLIDATSIVDRWMQLLRQTQIPLVRIMVDQSFHIIVLAGVAQIVSG